jgi:hypothetical protein
MYRTYLCPVDENETNLSLIQLRVEFFEQTTRGYLEEMIFDFTTTEKQFIVFAGKIQFLDIG